MACNDFFAPACVVLPVVSEGKGGGVVASQAIPRGTLLARQSYPLAWASRASPECGSCGGSTCGMLDRHHATTVTACDYCLRPYDHNNSRYADIPQDFVKQGSEGAPAKRCSRCRSVYYCSALCQREAWSSHKEECAIFKAFFELSGGQGPTLTQRLFLRLLLRGASLESFAEGHVRCEHQALDSTDSSAISDERASAKFAEVGPGESWRCACIDTSNSANNFGVHEYLESIDAFAELLSRVASALPEYVGHLSGEGASGSAFNSVASTLHSMPPTEIASLLRRLSANVYSITSGGGVVWSLRSGACECLDSGREVAIGLYGPPISRFNHSCTPNAVFGFGKAFNYPGIPVQMSVVAARPIAQGEEICVAYTNPFQKRSVRRKNLARGYGFNCTCPLCCCCMPGMTPRFLFPQGVSGRGSPKEDPINSGLQTGNLCPRADCCIPALCKTASDRVFTEQSQATSSLPDDICLPWAFDLQMNGVFCPQAACIRSRQSAAGDVRICLETRCQRLLNACSPSYSGCVGAEQHCVDGSPLSLEESDHQLLRPGIRVRPSILFAKFRTKCEWRPVQLSEDHGLAAGGLAKVVLGELVEVRCLRCRTVCEPSLLKNLQARLDKFLEIVSILETHSSYIRGEQQSTDFEGDAHRAASLLAALQVFMHPGNATLFELCSRLSWIVQPIPRLYIPLGLASSQHLVLAAGAAFGNDSIQRAEKLIIFGKMLLFLAQEDHTSLTASLWSALKSGDASDLGFFDGKLDALYDRNDSSSKSEEVNTDKIPMLNLARRKLLVIARNCFKDACSIFYSLACSEYERRQGRIAEESLEACNREYNLLESYD